jgi:hypothetical protein
MPKETSPDTHSIGGWVALKAGLNIMEKIKISRYFQELNPNSSVIQPAA